jgi:hypothetical protein
VFLGPILPEQIPRSMASNRRLECATEDDSRRLDRRGENLASLAECRRPSVESSKKGCVV